MLVPGRKLAAALALVALILPSISAFAQALSAADLQACCNTVYCPVHHRQGRNLQKDKSDCDAKSMPGQNDCSMRACDAPPNPALGTAAFILVAPFVLRAPLLAAAPVVLAFESFSSRVTFPLTPPPRLRLS